MWAAASASAGSRTMGPNHLKSVNLQYSKLGLLDNGTNESSTKRLMFQVLFF